MQPIFDGKDTFPEQRNRISRKVGQRNKRVISMAYSLIAMAKELDPVCGMEVDPTRSAFKVVYKGKVYYFCSSHCKRAFESDPEKYLRQGPQGMPRV